MPALLQSIPWWSAALLLAGCGVVAGSLSAFLGIGGGLLIVPLLNLLGMPVDRAVATSLAFIAATQVPALLRHLRAGRFSIPLALVVSATMIPFTEAASRLLPHLMSRAPYATETGVRIGLASVNLVIALLFFRKPAPFVPERFGEGPAPHLVLADGSRLSFWRAGGIGSGAGLLAGFLGVGGGALMVPAFTLFFGLPAAAAVATSTAVIFSGATFGSISATLRHQVELLPAFALLAGSLPASLLCAGLLKRLGERELRVSFAAVSCASIASLALKQVHAPRTGLALLGATALVVVTVLLSKSLSRKADPA